MPGIVIEERKLIYWPVPKNASTAMKVWIARMEGLDSDRPHTAAFRWTPEPLPGYASFALVRHPAIRLYSLWVNKVAAGHPIGERYVDGMDLDVFGRHLDSFWSEMPFEKFVATVAAIPYEDADPHWAPQSGQVPLVATWSRLEDVEPLLRLLLPEQNVSEYRAVWVAAYEESWRIICDYYAEDFARFGYVR